LLLNNTSIAISLTVNVHLVQTCSLCKNTYLTLKEACRRTCRYNESMFDNRYIYPLVSQKWILNSGKIMLRRVWRYQRDNQNLEIEEEQTTQWPKEKGQTPTYRSYT